MMSETTYILVIRIQEMYISVYVRHAILEFLKNKITDYI